MSMMVVGFRGAYFPLFRQAGFDISVFFYGGMAAPDDDTGKTLFRNDSARYSFFKDAYDPHLNMEVANRVRERALPIFSRTFLRSTARQHNAPPDWVTVQYHFENALNYYSKLLREREIKTILFSIIPHEGNYSVLYHLAKELGVATVICHQAIYKNSFWIMESIENYGVSPVRNDQNNVLPFERKPDTVFYLKGLEEPFQRGPWLAKMAGQGVLLTLRALILQFLWRPRSFNKRYTSLKHEWRRFQHQALHNDQFRDGIEHDKFIYFPLHHQPELSADIIGRRYGDQTLAIEELRRVVPEDIAIYVKENPKQTSMMRGAAFFRRIQSLPNTHLVRHYVSTLELSARCQMLATITGSAAYEALQMGKPVLHFGDAWFRDLPGVFDASDNAARAYHQAAEFTFDEEALRAAVADKATRLWRGVVNVLAIAEPELYDEAENRKMVVMSIADYFERCARPEALEAAQV